VLILIWLAPKVVVVAAPAGTAGVEGH
jgi:hypothetical protein